MGMEAGGPRRHHSPLRGPVLTRLGLRAGRSWLEVCLGKACAPGGVEGGDVHACGKVHTRERVGCCRK